MTTKERVLEQLEQQRGKSISGAKLAEQLSLSRNAVWKAITALRTEGYQIQAVTNKGYCLAPENDILSVQGILPFLSPDAAKYANQISVFDSLPSTNQKAKEYAVSGAAHGTVVIAETQTAGRGRYDRSFFSPNGGLYLSIVLHPAHLPFTHITAVTAFAANAVCETIEALSDRKPAVKWVNDVLIGGKKVCGILTEAVTDFESGGLSWIVLGIGINLTAQFPPELQKIAGAVFPDGAPAGCRNQFAASLINKLLTDSAIPDESALFAAYRARLLLPEAEITVQQGDVAYPASAVGINDCGHLIVRLRDGSQRILTSGEIRLPYPSA